MEFPSVPLERLYLHMLTYSLSVAFHFFPVKHFPIQTLFWNCIQLIDTKLHFIVALAQEVDFLWLVNCGFWFAMAWTLNFLQIAF